VTVLVDSKFNALKYLNTNCQINSFVVMNTVWGERYFG